MVRVDGLFVGGIFKFAMGLVKVAVTPQSLLAGGKGDPLEVLLPPAMPHGSTFSC